MDTYDDKISFDLCIDDCGEAMDLDDLIINSQECHLKKAKEINPRKLHVVKWLYLFPLILLGGLLFTTFLTLGINIIRYYNIAAGIFSILVAALSLLLTIGMIVKTKKQIKKLLHSE